LCAERGFGAAAGGQQNEDLRRDVLIKEEMKALHQHVEDLSEEMGQAEKNLDFSGVVIHDLRCKVASQQELLDATLEVEREAHAAKVTELSARLKAADELTKTLQAAGGGGESGPAEGVAEADVAALRRAVEEAEAAAMAEADKAAESEVQVAAMAKNAKQAEVEAAAATDKARQAEAQAEALRATSIQLQQQSDALAQRSREQQVQIERLRTLELEGHAASREGYLAPEEVEALRQRLTEAEAAVTESLELRQAAVAESLELRQVSREGYLAPEEVEALQQRLAEAEAAVAESLQLQTALLARTEEAEATAATAAAATLAQEPPAVAVQAAAVAEEAPAEEAPACAVHNPVKWKVCSVFAHFDTDGDGVLSEAELQVLLVTVNPHMEFTAEHLKAITSEVLDMYPEGLPLDGLLNTYLSDDSDGGNIDHDLEVLKLPSTAPCACQGLYKQRGPTLLDAERDEAAVGGGGGGGGGAAAAWTTAATAEAAAEAEARMERLQRDLEAQRAAVTAADHAAAVSEDARRRAERQLAKLDAEAVAEAAALKDQLGDLEVRNAAFAAQVAALQAAAVAAESGNQVSRLALWNPSHRWRVNSGGGFNRVFDSGAAPVEMPMERRLVGSLVVHLGCRAGFMKY